MDDFKTRDGSTGGPRDGLPLTTPQAGCGVLLLAVVVLWVVIVAVLAATIRVVQWAVAL